MLTFNSAAYNRCVGWAVIVSRLVFGAVFVFSGFVKAIDPVGSKYKFIDYFSAFGLDSFVWLALPLAVVLSVFEFVLGVTVLLGLERRFASVSALLVMCVMTPLTFYLAVANPVSDCGCFGDFLILSNWETFLKNLVLLSFALVLFCYNRRVVGVYNSLVQWLVVGFSIFYSFALCWIGFSYEPVFDFRPYKSGLDLRSAVHAGLDQVYETTLVYERGGERRSFSLEDYPADDSSWTFVETINVPVGGLREAITDFVIRDADGLDLTDGVLDDAEYRFLLLSPDLGSADDSEIDKINELFDYSVENNYGFLCVTALDRDAVAEWRDNTGAEYPFAFMDRKAIATIARSNPAMLLLKDGRIVWKRSARMLPDESELGGRLENISLGQVIERGDRRRLLVLISIFAVPLLLLFLMEKTVMVVVRKVKNDRFKRMLKRLSDREGPPDETGVPSGCAPDDVNGNT